MSLIPVTLFSFQRSPLQPKAYNHNYRGDNHFSSDTIISVIYNRQLNGSTHHQFNYNDASANRGNHVANFIYQWINRHRGHVDNTCGHVDKTVSNDVCVVRRSSEIYANKPFKCR